MKKTISTLLISFLIGAALMVSGVAQNRPTPTPTPAPKETVKVRTTPKDTPKPTPTKKGNN